MRVKRQALPGIGGMALMSSISFLVTWIKCKETFCGTLLLLIIASLLGPFWMCLIKFYKNLWL